MRTLPTFTVLAATMAVAITAAPAAGTVSLRWSATPGATGYRVFYGTAAGSYGSQMDAGSATTATVSGLTDCAPAYFAVKAYDAVGTLSESYSNVVSGWARPTVTAVSPAAAEQGRRLTLTIDGTNFNSGAALTFSTPGITVHAITVQSCNRLTADVTIGTTATTGSGSVTVMNLDRTFGTRSGGLSVQAAVAPTVSVTSPTNGSTQVATSVQPTVTFSEPLLPGSVLPTTVRLLDDTGTAVALAAGFPTLSSDGRTATLKPAAALAAGKTYRVQVTGGLSGVLDLAGLGLAATFTQATGFATLPPTAVTVMAEAEDGVTTAPIRIISGTEAFDGGWVDTPTGSPAGTPSAPTGTVALDLYVPTSGTWKLWLRLYAPDAASNGWFESVDGAVRQPLLASTGGAWEWVAGRSYTLSAGLHRVELGGLAEQARADRVLLANESAYVPTSAPTTDTVSPLPPATFTVSPGSGSNTLSWTASPSSDQVKTVIRYRTDGVFPRTPVDGLPATEQNGAPGSPGSFNHTGLTNGTVYSYAAFALDSAANGSNSMTGSGTPGGGASAKPGKVKNPRRR
jgi:hypothetical protein